MIFWYDNDDDIDDKNDNIGYTYDDINATRSQDDGSYNYRYILQAEFLNFHLGIRVAMGLFTLSLLVGSRFVGYFSIGKF